MTDLKKGGVIRRRGRRGCIGIESAKAIKAVVGG